MTGFKKTRANVKRLIKNLPSILSGKIRDHYLIRAAFEAAFIHQLFTEISHSYLMKAHGGSDQFGQRWLPLHPKTVKKRMSTAMVNKYPLSSRLLTLILTERFYRSIQPGTVVSDTYKRSDSFQVARVNRGSIEIGTRRVYANRQFRRRPLFPPNNDELIDRAAKAGMQAVTRRLREIMS